MKPDRMPPSFFRGFFFLAAALFLAPAPSCVRQNAEGKDDAANAWRDPLWLAFYENDRKEEAASFSCPMGTVFIPSGGVASRYDGTWNKDEPKKGEARKVAAFCMDRFEYPNERFAMPRVRAGWAEAQRLCGKSEKRLCREDEWELACTAGKGWSFSYGPERIPHQCNADNPTDDISAVAPAGSRIECRNPYGVFDLNGNVSEWVAATEADFHGVVGVVRGDTAWISGDYGGSCHSRHAHPIVSNEYGDDGFRCCAEAKRKEKK